MENFPLQILKVLYLGLECEIDIWYINNKYYLGHDFPNYSIEEKFLEHNKLWCHAKNIQALQKMIKNNKIHCFWHENDKVTLTSKSYIWSFPSNKVIKDSIAVLPELYNTNISECTGICSDFCYNYV